MKKIFTLIIAIMAAMMPMMAEKSDGTTPSTPITMDVHPIDDIPNETIHRAPMRVPVEAWYDACSGTISIVYYGEATGEVHLYCDETLIDSSSEITTIFQTTGPGVYTIEIMGESWTAIGDIEI